MGKIMGNIMGNIKNNIVLTGLVVLLMCCLTSTGWAGEEKDAKKEFSGTFLVGYRGVDVDGVESKYREDYNLDSGPRLFKFKFHFVPQGALKKLFDRMDVALHNVGGDPFESFNFSVVKYGKYDFRYDRRKSGYFYNDMLAGHDLHTFDFDRVQDSAGLKVWVTDNMRFYFDFERWTRKGTATTSLDISRDEFQFHQPMDEASQEVTLGLDFTAKGFTLLLQEKIRDYKNDYHFFLPGFSEGEDLDDPANLGYLYFSQPYDFRTFTHSAQFSARPSERFLLKGSAQYMMQNLRLSYSESAMGTTYRGTPMDYSYYGDGEYDRNIGLFDVDMTYLLSHRFALVAAVRYHRLEQDGTMDIYDTQMPMDFEYNTLGLEAGFQYRANAKLGITAGLRSEKREVTFIEHGGLEKNTDRTGIFTTVNARPAKKLDITADYQMGSYDDPFTPISPTEFHRARFSARFKFKGVYLSGAFLYQLTENDIDEGWDTERARLNFRSGYHGDKWGFSMGYGLMYSRMEGDRHFIFSGVPTIWNIFYEGRANLFDISLHLALGEKINLCGDVDYYKNDGSWEVERTILRPYMKIKFPGGFIGKLMYSYIDFKENLSGLNNYRADIFEVSFGYLW